MTVCRIITKGLQVCNFLFFSLGKKKRKNIEKSFFFSSIVKKNKDFVFMNLFLKPRALRILIEYKLKEVSLIIFFCKAELYYSYSGGGLVKLTKLLKSWRFYNFSWRGLEASWGPLRACVVLPLQTTPFTPRTLSPKKSVMLNFQNSFASRIQTVENF